MSKFDNRKVLDIIAKLKVFTLNDVLQKYFGMSKHCSREEIDSITEYLRQLCAVKVLRRRWWSKKFSLICDLESPV